MILCVFVCLFEKLLNVFAFAIFPVNNANTTAMWTTEVDDTVTTEHRSPKFYVVEKLKEDLDTAAVYLSFYHNTFCLMIKQWIVLAWVLKVLYLATDFTRNVLGRFTFSITDTETERSV
jgi:hypothetical protein